MKKVHLLFLVSPFLISTAAYADKKSEANCACLDARTVLFLGAAEGKTPRDYGVKLDISLLTWVELIDMWRNKLGSKAFSCPPSDPDAKSVATCKKFMKKYPDGM